MRSSLALAAAVTLAGHALAQSSTASASASDTPTATLFLPMASAGGANIAASVITAAPSSTVYAIGCLSSDGACAGDCTFDSSVTVTEGESTLRYTWTAGNRAMIAVTSGSLTQDITTVNCALLGGTRATQAICTGASAVQGLGNGTQTTTLASSQLNSVPVTVTAGVENMNAASHSPSGPSGTSGGASGGGGGSGSGSATSSAGAAVATAVRWGVGVVAGVGAVALL